MLIKAKRMVGLSSCCVLDFLNLHVYAKVEIVVLVALLVVYSLLMWILISNPRPKQKHEESMFLFGENHMNKERITRTTHNQHIVTRTIYLVGEMPTLTHNSP